MKTQLLGLLVFIGLSCAGLACSSSSSPSGPASSNPSSNADGGGGGSSGGGGGGMDLTTYYQKLTAVGCSKSFDCCHGGGDDPLIAKNWRNGATSKSDCANATIPSALDDERKGFAAAIGRGALAFNADHAQACLDAYAAQSCNDFYNNPDDHVPSACVPVFTGKVAMGGSCDDRMECADHVTKGATCWGSPGVCQILPKAGEACPSDGICALGMYCEKTSKTCAVQKSQGAPCDPVNLECKGLCDLTAKVCGPDIVITPVCQG